jgi:signal transduction histidine kinase
MTIYTSQTDGIFKSLYWKISLTFLLILLVLAFAYVYATAFSAKLYFEATHQRLNREVASHIAKFMSPFVNKTITLNNTQTKRVFFNVMVMNPSAEVYLLNSQGNILSYFAPEKKIIREKVSLTPILKFINTKGSIFILGDDPKSSNAMKIFSAAKVEKNNVLLGYIYVVLASEEYDSATGLLLQSHIFKLGTKTMLITLVAAFVAGLLAFRFIMQNLDKIMQTVKGFREGNLQARIKVNSRDELAELAHTFNEMADTLEKNLEELKTVEKLRRELIANVSHDLRTPIAAVHGYAETIVMKKDSLSPAERDRYTNIILQSTENLAKLVDQLFELSKLETIERKPHLEVFNIAELVQEVYHQYLILAGQKKIAMYCSNCHNNFFTRADIGMMERVLQNLIDNAIKYTPKEGTIFIRLSSQDNQLEILVSNTGPGIPTAYLPHIFERYSHKLTSGSTVPPSGMGLGLVIVKRILDLHGFTIDVQTQPEQETHFRFQLPIVY